MCFTNERNFDTETCQLLAASPPTTTSKKKMTIEVPTCEICFKCGKLVTGQETGLVSTLGRMLSKFVNKQDPGKLTAELCQVMVCSLL